MSRCTYSPRIWVGLSLPITRFFRERLFFRGCNYVSDVALEDAQLLYEQFIYPTWFFVSLSRIASFIQLAIGFISLQFGLRVDFLWHLIFLLSYLVHSPFLWMLVKDWLLNLGRIFSSLFCFGHLERNIHAKTKI